MSMALKTLELLATMLMFQQMILKQRYGLKCVLALQKLMDLMVFTETFGLQKSNPSSKLVLYVARADL